jgi:polysaccharide export outer membrane protein
MAGHGFKTYFFLVGYVACCLCLSAAPQKSSKDLFDYIQEARKLGLRDEQIRQNALSAGWDQTTIEQTYSIVRLLYNEKLPPGTGLKSPMVLPEAYRIGAGDVLQIAVWREPEASVPAAVVRVDGKISVPLIDEVDAAGYTPLELEKVLGDRFSKYIKNPVVTVIAATINSKRVYVVGGVKKEGPISMVRPMTVLQALNEAGGLVDFARKRKIYVLRNENGKQVKLPFDYQTVLKGEHLEQNIELLPDDTIVVPQ